VQTRYDLELEEIAALLDDLPAYRARQIFEGLHRGLRTPEEMTDLPVALRDKVATLLVPALSSATESVTDDGETTKWAFALEDGSVIETVLMAYPDRVTVCVSTQAGCAMACSFCATGQGGFRRHLSVGEIVEQVVTAARAAGPRRLSNIVFMGMGEPLANYDRLLGAIRRLNGPLGIGARKMTVSTVGIVPGIRRLAAEPLEVGLAVSLHSANDRRRDELVPINKRYPLGVLADACGEYVAATHRRLTFEWALIEGVNDTDTDVGELAAYARPLRAHVNLIPLNPTPGYLVRGSTPQRVAQFAAALEAAGVTTTVRNTRGREIDAACGQLAARTEVNLRPKPAR
jgi:23S rRNA (adenine2503-C2)-methyltransferase